MRSNADALMHDIVSIAQAAVVWKNTPEQIGGQSNGPCREKTGCYTGINFKKLGYVEKGSPFRWENANGQFFITERNEALGVRGCNTAFGNNLLIEQRGMSDDTIVIVERTLSVDKQCTRNE
jgi:hypothetical protein